MTEHVCADELTTAEAADILGVSTSTVVHYADTGQLPCRRLPSGHRRYLRADVEALTEPEPAA